MREMIKMRSIVDWLTGSKLKSKALYDYIIEKIFPDIYDENKTSDAHNASHEALRSLYKIKQEGSKDSYTYWSALLRGNTRPDGTFPEGGTSEFIDDLKISLLNNKYITYREGISTKSQSVLRNMLEKIECLVEEGKILEKTDYLKINLDRECLYTNELVIECNYLFETGTEKSIAYLIFLFILVSFYQEKISELSILYSREKIDAVLNNEEEEISLVKIDTVKSSAFVPLDDKNYKNKYNVYLFKPTYEKKFDCGSLVFEENDDGSLRVMLELEDVLDTPLQQGKTFKKIYEGQPIRSIVDELVYIIFTSANGTLSILCFRYDKFNYAEMYYRTALFITSYPRKKVPQVQKMIISLNELKDSDIIDGILKMSSDMVTITERELKNFIKANETEVWMEDFKENLLPFIKAHSEPCYRFSEKELIYYTLCDSDEYTKIEIVKMLKANSVGDNIIDCIDLENLHRVIKRQKKE